MQHFRQVNVCDLLNVSTLDEDDFAVLIRVFAPVFLMPGTLETM